MREHLMRWLQLELSPADAAILAEMHARELGKLQHNQDDGGHEDGNHGTLSCGEGRTGTIRAGLLGCLSGR